VLCCVVGFEQTCNEFYGPDRTVLFSMTYRLVISRSRTPNDCLRVLRGF
jgi:hypothetical protein